MADFERRVLATSVELRATGGGKGLRGLAIPYNVLSGDLGGFREQIAEGAATEALKSSDVRVLFNHNPDNLLGRQSAGTLRVTETRNGVSYDIPDLPDTTAGEIVRVGVARGDITGNSLSFVVAEGGEEWTQHNGTPVRTITKFQAIHDVGPVTYPAYTDTKVATRCLARAKMFATPVRPSEALRRMRKEQDRRERMASDWSLRQMRLELERRERQAARRLRVRHVPRDDPLYELALHEAGHAVTDTVLGQEVLSVFIDADGTTGGCQCLRSGSAMIEAAGFAAGYTAEWLNRTGPPTLYGSDRRKVVEFVGERGVKTA